MKIKIQVATDSGVCCAFNSEFSLKPSTYSNQIRNLQDMFMFNTLATGHLNESKTEIVEPRKVQVGEKKGLKIWIGRQTSLTF